MPWCQVPLGPGAVALVVGAGTPRATSIGPTPIFPLSIVLLSSSLFASKYTDLVPTRLLPGVGNILDSTVQSLPLALTPTGTGPAPRFPDPTSITGRWLEEGKSKQCFGQSNEVDCHSGQLLYHWDSLQDLSVHLCCILNGLCNWTVTSYQYLDMEPLATFQLQWTLLTTLLRKLLSCFWPVSLVHGAARLLYISPSSLLEI